MKNQNKEQTRTTLRVETFELGCSGGKANVLNDSASIREMLLEISRLAGLTPIATRIHRFPSQGLTGYMILAESHISIHTWPEYGFAILDIQTCNAHAKISSAISYIKRHLGLRRIKVARRTLVTRIPL